jgi:hypothetical protein
MQVLKHVVTAQYTTAMEHHTVLHACHLMHMHVPAQRITDSVQALAGMMSAARRKQ